MFPDPDSDFLPIPDPGVKRHRIPEPARIRIKALCWIWIRIQTRFLGTQNRKKLSVENKLNFSNPKMPWRTSKIQRKPTERTPSSWKVESVKLLHFSSCIWSHIGHWHSWPDWIWFQSWFGANVWRNSFTVYVIIFNYTYMRSQIANSRIARDEIFGLRRN